METEGFFWYNEMMKKTNTATPLPEEEKPEITGVHTITRGSVQKRLAQSESEVPFYDEANFPSALQLPEALKKNALAVEVHRQAKKILCGEEANISQRDFDYAKQFIEILIAPSARTAEDAAHLQTLESLVNADLTRQIEKKTAFDESDSILNQGRKRWVSIRKKMKNPFYSEFLKWRGKISGKGGKMERNNESTRYVCVR